MNIVMVPFHDYKKWKNEGFRTRDAHMCQHFKNNDKVNKILVINRPTSLAEVILKKQKWAIDSGEIVYKRNSIQLTKMDNKTWCLDIFLLDFLKIALQKKAWWFTAFNYKKVADAVNEAIRYLEIEDNILLLQNPMAIGAVHNFIKEKFVFDAIDNWLYHPQMPNKKLIQENYSFVDRNADAIMTVSEALIKVFSRNRNVNWIPNGVDIEYFSDAINDKINEKKIIGYVGKIQERVDFDLVEKCVRECPNEEFVFLGPIYTQQERIKFLTEKYPNIHFEGDVHYSKLPQKMKTFDITIIPHKVDTFTESMNPLKLYEYLASGKPVVTRGVAGTEAISKYVIIADSEEKFVDALKSMVRDIDEIDKSCIVKSVPNECRWSSRSKRMLSLFEEL